MLAQKVAIAFQGENQAQGYGVDIDVKGDWKPKPLEPYVGSQWLSQLTGHSVWNAGVDLQLNDVGFTYQIGRKG